MEDTEKGLDEIWAEQEEKHYAVDTFDSNALHEDRIHSYQTADPQDYAIQDNTSKKAYNLAPCPNFKVAIPKMLTTCPICDKAIPQESK